MHTTNFNIADLNQESKNHQRQRSKLSCYQKVDQPTVLQGIIENLIDGILIVSTESELIYVNDIASRILRQLNQNKLPVNFPPKEIWHICQSLIQSRHLFPDQTWQIASDIFVDSSSVFKVHARWFQAMNIDSNCILITIKDYYQTIKNIAVEESQKYGLTPREREVWTLQRANYTYKEIAAELCITPNTVKKHIKSIHSKQKEVFDVDE